MDNHIIAIAQLLRNISTYNAFYLVFTLFNYLYDITLVYLRFTSL